MKKTLIAYILAALALATYVLGSLTSKMPEVEVAIILFALVTVSLGNAALQVYHLLREELEPRTLPAVGLVAGLFVGIYIDMHTATQPFIISLLSLYEDAAIVAVLVNGILLLRAYVPEGVKESRTSSAPEI